MSAHTGRNRERGGRGREGRRERERGGEGGKEREREREGGGEGGRKHTTIEVSFVRSYKYFKIVNNKEIK